MLKFILTIILGCGPLLFTKGTTMYARDRGREDFYVLRQNRSNDITRNRLKSQLFSEGLYKRSSFPIGVAVNNQTLKDDKNYRKIVVSQFNSITAENIFKPKYLHPQENNYYWKDADELVRFCERYHKRIHGHTLIWVSSQSPDWWFYFKGSRKDWLNMMKEHIQTTVSHFRGKVESWDVVNEAFDNSGNLVDNIFSRNIGPDYIEKAFQYAAAADPKAKLFYNDHSIVGSPAKIKAILQMVEDLRSKNIRIDGIGMQMHINMTFPTLNDLSAVVKAISKQKLLIHFSELDISVNSNDLNNIGWSDELMQAQARRFYEIINLYKQIPKPLRYGITLWGISDNTSWLNRKDHLDWPLLYDKDLNPKPAYYAFKKALLSNKKLALRQ